MAARARGGFAFFAAFSAFACSASCFFSAAIYSKPIMSCPVRRRAIVAVPVTGVVIGKLTSSFEAQALDRAHCSRPQLARRALSVALYVRQRVPWTAGQVRNRLIASAGWQWAANFRHPLGGALCNCRKLSGGDDVGAGTPYDLSAANRPKPWWNAALRLWMYPPEPLARALLDRAHSNAEPWI